MLQNNIENVIFEQIEFCYHNTTGLRCVDSLILFDGHSTFVNNLALKVEALLYINYNYY